jgi:hypothetical protein
MGRTPEPFGSMVPDPRILCEFMGHKRGPLGLFSWVEFTNLWAEPLQAHLYSLSRWAPTRGMIFGGEFGDFGRFRESTGGHIDLRSFFLSFFPP